MTIRPILTAPDPRLKAVSKSVDSVDAATRKLIDDMIDSMYEADGIGLAAVQIGVAQRVIVMDLDQKDGKKNPRAFINPVITVALGGTGDVRGRLPLGAGDLRGRRTRRRRSRRSFSTVTASNRFLEADGLLATCLQHEMDHLEGVLFIDHLSKLKRSIALRKLQKAKRLKETG